MADRGIHARGGGKIERYREREREREREKEGMRETTICIFRVAVLWQDGGDDAEDDEPHGLHAGKDFLQ